MLFFGVGIYAVGGGEPLRTSQLGMTPPDTWTYSEG